MRETSLAIVREPGRVISGAVAPSLAPLIERMFRYTWFLAAERRDAMVREGREEEVDALIAEGRDKLRRGSTDANSSGEVRVPDCRRRRCRMRRLRWLEVCFAYYYPRASPEVWRGVGFALAHTG